MDEEIVRFGDSAPLRQLATRFVLYVADVAGWIWVYYDKHPNPREIA